MKTCVNCGAQTEEGEIFCAKCGAATTSAGTVRTFATLGAGVKVSIVAGIAVVVTALGIGIGYIVSSNEPPPTPPPSVAVSSTLAPTPTEEPPCEHDWRDANFQQPKTCQLCHATDGEPLTPGFVLHGIEANVGQGRVTPYVTITSDGSRETVGKAIYGGAYSTSEYYDQETGMSYQAEAGYEVVEAAINILFDDENALKGSAAWAWVEFLDYYLYDPLETFDDTTASYTPIPGLTESFTVNIYGEDVEIFYRNESNSRWEGEGESLQARIRFWIYMPKGYDGLHVALVSADYPKDLYQAGDLTFGEVLDDDAVIIRIVPD